MGMKQMTNKLKMSLKPISEVVPEGLKVVSKSKSNSGDQPQRTVADEFSVFHQYTIEYWSIGRRETVAVGKQE